MYQNTFFGKLEENDECMNAAMQKKYTPKIESQLFYDHGYIFIGQFQLPILITLLTAFCMQYLRKSMTSFPTFVFLF